MRLKARDTVRISRGPLSASGAGAPPRPTSRAAAAIAPSGRDSAEAMSQAPASARPSSARPPPSHCSPNAGSKRSRGSITQYSSSSMLKLTQKPATPSRA
jgi:hypothetical protein